VTYPKNWNLYVGASGSGTEGIDWYFNPGFIPSVKLSSARYALRVQVVNSSYSSVVAKYSKATGTTVSAYKLPSKDAAVSSVVGTKIDGQIAKGMQGSLVILPLRDKTIELWTELPTYLEQFNTIILPNVTFVP